MSHTPGPWKTGPINYADVYGADGSLVALICKDREETVDDALLIAAAPDLLAALRDAWRVLKDCALDTAGTPSSDMFIVIANLCGAAIEKATGPETVEHGEKKCTKT